MTNSEKLTEAFVEGLEISESRVDADLQYDTVAAWDSIAHMDLIMELEERFEVSIETDDVVELDSIEKAREILESHGVEFD